MESSEEPPAERLGPTSILPIGLEAMLGGAVEGARLELKASWDETTTGPQILKTLCAFANDLQNLNGGYILIGVAEHHGVAVRPVKGLLESELDQAQKWLRGHCNRFEPIYMPVIDTPTIDGRRVLVLWAPASDVRPHLAPDGPRADRKYWVRIGSETVEAKAELLTRLMQQTARVPFDDRRAFDASNEDLRLSLAREYLHDVGSELVREPDAERVYTAMQITRRQNGHTVPRNIGLLFFSDDPLRWFRGARIEVVEFRDDAGGDAIDEKVFKGPIHEQLRQALSWLEGMTVRHLQKQHDVPEAKSWVSYPMPALREALVNAVYHRSYEADVVEPIKVYLYPNRVQIASYPGPVDGIELEHLRGDKPLPLAPARNRRIGAFLKELKLAEERGTGLLKIVRAMKQNGSPAPIFSFDAKRTYFSVTLPAHPEYVATAILRDFAYQKATGDDAAALRILQQAWSSGLRSLSIAMPLVSALADAGDLAAARAVERECPDPKDRAFGRLLTSLAAAHYEAGDESNATMFYEAAAHFYAELAALEQAVEVGEHDPQTRHRVFRAAEGLVLQDARAAFEFARTKLNLANDPDGDVTTRLRLLQEANLLLERVVQMDAHRTRRAWAWYELGRVRRWLKRPPSEVIDALEHAVALAPSEQRFVDELARTRATTSRAP